MSSLPARRAGRRAASSRAKSADAAMSADAAIASVFIGAPAQESFTDSVFDNALQDAVRFRPQVTGMDAFRKEIIDFLTARAPGANNSLDIVADAPSGVQRMPIVDNAGNATALHPLIDLLSDPGSTVDDDLVALIQQRFVRCRLLGCVTAVDAEIRAAVKTLARRLQMPIFGTTRTIAYTDFDATSFKDAALAPRQGEHQPPKTLDPITPDATHGDLEKLGPPVNRDAQQSWLGTFSKVKLTGDHLTPSGAPIGTTWQLGFELIGAHLPTTDVIRTAPLGFVIVECPSGTTSRAEVLARGTLLRLPAKLGPPIYINVALDDPMRHSWLSHHGLGIGPLG
jgi:hypothetical protein